MATKPHKPSEEPRHANGEAPLTSDEGSSPMAKPQYRNGPDLSPDTKEVVQRAWWLFTFVIDHWKAIGLCASFAAGGGLVAYLPVTQRQLAAYQAEVKRDIGGIQTELAQHQTEIKEIKSDVKEILYRVTPPPAPVPAAIQESPPPRKKVSRPKPASGFTRIFGR